MVPGGDSLIGDGFVAVGSRSVVRQHGVGVVAKIPFATTPSWWVDHEMQYTRAVWATGVPCHQPLTTETIDGVVAGLYVRADGPTMWSLILDAPERASWYGALLAHLHCRVMSSTPPVTLPRRSDRLRSKLRQVQRARGSEPSDLAWPFAGSSDVSHLCHGDFHPGNVMMTGGGPVIVDWFDACRGDVIGEVARTSLLLGAGRLDTAFVDHLPGQTADLLGRVHEAYLGVVCSRFGLDRASVELARRAEAMARVAEGAAWGPMLALSNDTAPPLPEPIADAPGPIPVSTRLERDRARCR